MSLKSQIDTKVPVACLFVIQNTDKVEDKNPNWQKY